MPIFRSSRELDYVNQRLTNVEAVQRLCIWIITIISGCFGLAFISLGQRLYNTINELSKTNQAHAAHLQTVSDLRPYHRIDKLEEAMATMANTVGGLADAMKNWTPVLQNTERWLDRGKLMWIIMTTPGAAALVILALQTWEAFQK